MKNSIESSKSHHSPLSLWLSCLLSTLYDALGAREMTQKSTGKVKNSSDFAFFCFTAFGSILLNFNKAEKKLFFLCFSIESISYTLSSARKLIFMCNSPWKINIKKNNFNKYLLDFQTSWVFNTYAMPTNNNVTLNPITLPLPTAVLPVQTPQNMKRITTITVIEIPLWSLSEAQDSCLRPAVWALLTVMILVPLRLSKILACFEANSDLLVFAPKGKSSITLKKDVSL